MAIETLRTEVSGELRLREPLLNFLSSTRWIRSDTLIVSELPWHGRRIDMVTRSRGGVLTSYEFKLGSFGRVLEQAIYNRMSFDRSYLVIAAMPRTQNLAEAIRHNVGVILVTDGATRCLARSQLARAEPILRRRLANKVLELGAMNV